MAADLRFENEQFTPLALAESVNAPLTLVSWTSTLLRNLLLLRLNVSAVIKLIPLSDCRLVSEIVTLDALVISFVKLNCERRGKVVHEISSTETKLGQENVARTVKESNVIEPPMVWSWGRLMVLRPVAPLMVMSPVIS